MSSIVRSMLRSPALRTSLPKSSTHRYHSLPCINTIFKHSHPTLLTPSEFCPIARFFSTVRRQPSRAKIDIGARARQLQNKRLWTYAITFSCIAGFIVVVLSNFQDSLVFYMTPTDLLEKFTADPSKNKFRLGGLVLEGSVDDSKTVEFIMTDLKSYIVVRFKSGMLPDLFKEGTTAVAEGFVKPLTEEDRNSLALNGKTIATKAFENDCFFEAIEVLAKHDEKYMPAEVAAALAKNRAEIAAEAEAGAEVEQVEAVNTS